MDGEGNLVITAIQDGNVLLRQGLKPGFVFPKYGRFEARLKPPTARVLAGFLDAGQ
jgi:hypothetical protein